MKELDENAASLSVQKSHLDETSKKISEISSAINNLMDYERENALSIKKVNAEISFIESHLEENEDDFEFDSDEIDDLLLEIDLIEKEEVSELSRVNSLSIDFLIKDDMSWNEYMSSINHYAENNNINISSPFDGLLSKSQEADLRKKIQEEFTYKTPDCDRYDYLIAGTSGLLCGLIDIVFVGAPGKSTLGDGVDGFANVATEKFAKCMGWDADKALEKGSNTTASAIGFLERKFKINYDQATSASVGGAVNNLSLKNHHLKSIGHSPDIIGLFFSVLNQFTNTSTFISNGKIITVDTEDFSLQGSNFVSKVFCGVANWFGHIMSDWAGSSGTVGQGGRGTGVPIPFYNLFLSLNFGEFGTHKQSFATIATKVFEQGYDTRHGIAMAIPVLINELIIRLCWVVKARFYHGKEWEQCIPSERNPELKRMICVGHGALCLVDGADATIRGGGEPVATLLRMNLIAWIRFAHLSLKELNSWIQKGKIDHDEINLYLDKEFEQLLRSSYGRTRP